MVIKNKMYVKVMITGVLKLGYRMVQIEVILVVRMAGGAVRAGGAPRPHCPT